MMLAGLQDGRAIAERLATIWLDDAGRAIAERLATVWLDDAGRSSGWQGQCRATGASVHDLPAHHQGQGRNLEKSHREF
jgi:hypothetical protein